MCACVGRLHGGESESVVGASIDGQAVSATPVGDDRPSHASHSIDHTKMGVYTVVAHEAFGAAGRAHWIRVGRGSALGSELALRAAHVGRVVIWSTGIELRHWFANWLPP